MLVGAFNQEKALVGAFSVIVQPVVEPMELYTALFRNMKKVIASRSKSDSAPAKDSAAPRLSVSSLPSVSATPKLVPKSRSVNFSRQSSRESSGAHAQEARRSSKEEAEEGGHRNGGGELWDQEPGTDTLHQVQVICDNIICPTEIIE